MTRRQSLEELELAPLLDPTADDLPDMSISDKRVSEDIEKVERDSVVPSFSEDFSPEDERRLVRRLDRRILTVACILYLFACESSPESREKSS